MKAMKFRLLFAFLLIVVSTAVADIVDDVRGALEEKNFRLAEAQLQQYRSHHDADPQYLVALSWMGRASLAAGQLGAAETYAKQTESQVLTMLKHRALDADADLPIALGAALEVQAQVLQGQGEHAKAVALLKKGLATYANTSIVPRLQKNLNLLTLTGQAAPALAETDYLGPKPATLAQMKGSPVLLFFWAHWCIDCKHEAPILVRLRSEYKDLKVLAPTQLYGYGARGEETAPTSERSYIDQVWKQYYAGLAGVPVPISKQNFSNYGASTTPTLVLVDKTGHVVLYHPGVLSYDDLRAAIDKTMNAAGTAGAH